jgi:Leucine-rich repeat (LRR) protein
LIPSEIKHMYDISEESDVVWSECVDLTKFIAADNKLEALEDDVFPDKTNTELEDAEAADYNGLLRGLESLDLHSNLLKALPLGLRRLEKLRSLNLSGNKLGQNAFGIVCQLGDGLTELKMSQNELSGPLPDHIKNLSSLQVLNLDGNKISEIPNNLQELVHLKVLNLADNKLSSIPCEILATLPLVELIISGNQLSGVLFSSEIQSTTKTLKLLDVSRNKLDALGAPQVVSASVQTVNLSGNRLKIPPDISSWRELLTFAIAENMIAEVPPGLVTLRKLRNADLSNNNITKIDNGIAFMENLVSINLAGNPLRERKYLTMAADDLKADLQKRDLGLDASLAPDLEMPRPNSSSGGILDWSSKSLSGSELPLMSLDSPVFDICLHHNSLDTIPVSLLSLPPISQTLRSLDISHNPLQTPCLSSPISLPQLKDLSLVSCHLKDLDAVTSNLSAPKMTTLNLSANHLSGPLPPLRIHFRSLITLLAANNQFSLLEVASTQGLVTLDIRNNEIDHLEPKLGLLGGKAGLKCLEVSGNKFRVPRREVLVKGTEAILRYLKGRMPLEELEDEATRTEVDAGS